MIKIDRVENIFPSNVKSVKFSGFYLENKKNEENQKDSLVQGDEVG